jgi:hypothetical protein
MQIIQPLLGTQVNTLGQKSYLGNHHISQEASPYHRYGNFIKPLFTSSKHFLARKRQPFIDTLFADGDNLGLQDSDADLSEMELNTFNFISEGNTTDVRFDISNVSNILQTQVASNLSNEIITEESVQPKPNKKKKSPTKKATPSNSSNKSKTQKSTKASSKKKLQTINKYSSFNNVGENLLITDNLPDKALDSLAIQQKNVDDTTIAKEETKIVPKNSEENLDPLSENTNDTNSVITNLLSDSKDNVYDYVSRETEIQLNQDDDFDSVTDNFLENSTLEFVSDNIGKTINIDNNSPNYQQSIHGVDAFKNPDYSQEEIEYINNKQQNNLNQPNDISKVTIAQITEENILHNNRDLNAINENVSRLPEIDNQPQLIAEANDSNIENQPLASNILSPKLENISNSVSYFDNAQDKPIVSEVNYSENNTRVNKSVNSESKNNNVETSPQLYQDNLTTESINHEAVELTSTQSIINSQTNLSRTPEEASQPNQTIATSDIPSLNSPKNPGKFISIEATNQSEITPSIPLQQDYSSALTNIQDDTTSITTPEIENSTTTDLAVNKVVNIQPATPDIKQKFISEKTNIQHEIALQTKSESEDNNFPELETIKPVEPLLVSDENQQVAIPEAIYIQHEITETNIADTTTTEIAANTLVNTSPVLPDIQQDDISDITNTNIQPVSTSLNKLEIENNSLPEITAIAPISTSPISSEIQPETTATNIEDTTTTEITAIAPISPSPISSEIQPEATATNIEDTTTTEITAIAPVTTSPISPDQQVSIPEVINIQPETTAQNLEDNTTTEITAIAPISPSPISSEIQPETTATNIEDTTTTEITAIARASSQVEFKNTSDISENTSPQDNVDNTSSTDIVPTISNLPAPKGYATGGQVTTTSVENHQPVAPSDIVPAMLTPGEFVINAKDAQKNIQILKHINTGGSPEQMISPRLEVTHPQTPEETHSLTPTTKVDSFVETPLQRQSAELDTSPEATPLSSPSLGVEIGKQRLSRLNSPQIHTVENTTNTPRESSSHYSSPSLIFRKINSTTNTQTPSQWSSVEDLLNSDNDEFTNFNFGSVENNWQNSPSSQFASSSTPSDILTKRLATPQGFAKGGEVLAPDISRDIAPVTETIKSPSSTLPTQENGNNEDDAKLEALAQEIYYRLRQRIEIEKERHGIYVGRLPW